MSDGPYYEDNDGLHMLAPGSSERPGTRLTNFGAKIVGDIPGAVRELRRRFEGRCRYPRVAEALADLLVGFRYFLSFAHDIGVINIQDAHRLDQRAWNALVATADAQAEHYRDESPAPRSLDLLRSALAAGRVHLCSVDGRMPENALSYGWRCDEYGLFRPCGRRIGWVDGNDIYLIPTEAYAIVNGSNGNGIGVSERTWRKRLSDDGRLVTTTPGRGLTVRRMLEGARKDVLHLRASDLVLNTTEATGNGDSDQSSSSPSRSLDTRNDTNDVLAETLLGNFGLVPSSDDDGGVR